MKMLSIIVATLIVFLFCFFFMGFPKEKENIIWGVNFSQKHARNLGLDWQKVYLALIEEMKVKNMKIAVHWDIIEPAKGVYNFDDLDWQIAKAEENGVRVFLVIGMKTTRWPECHIPNWAIGLEKEEQQKNILAEIEKIVLRYKNSKTIWAWQVENEPFFPFGKCPWRDDVFLKKEIELVKSLDSRPVIITESGEFPFWFKAAKYGDIVGATTYRKTWFNEIKMYISYPFTPTFYNRKISLIKKIFNKKVIGVEFQAEPWGPTFLYTSPVEEQKKTMNLEQFRKNIHFAKKTNFGEIYLWGSEWWYWMKEKQNDPEIWEEAKKLFTK